MDAKITEIFSSASLISLGNLKFTEMEFWWETQLLYSHLYILILIAHYANYLHEVKLKGKSLSRVRLFANPWTAAHQAPLSTGFSSQEYWSGLPFPSPGDLPGPGIEPGLHHCRQILYHLSHQGSPLRFPIIWPLLDPWDIHLVMELTKKGIVYIKRHHGGSLGHTHVHCPTGME